MDVVLSLIGCITLLIFGVAFAVWQIRAHMEARRLPGQPEVPKEEPDLDGVWFHHRRRRR